MGRLVTLSAHLMAIWPQDNYRSWGQIWSEPMKLNTTERFTSPKGSHQFEYIGSLNFECGRIMARKMKKLRYISYFLLNPWTYSNGSPSPFSTSANVWRGNCILMQGKQTAQKAGNLTIYSSNRELSRVISWIQLNRWFHSSEVFKGIIVLNLFNLAFTISANKWKI